MQRQTLTESKLCTLSLSLSLSLSLPFLLLLKRALTIFNSEPFKSVSDKYKFKYHLKTWSLFFKFIIDFYSFSTLLGHSARCGHLESDFLFNLQTQSTLVFKDFQVDICFTLLQFFFLNKKKPLIYQRLLFLLMLCIIHGTHSG